VSGSSQESHWEAEVRMLRKEIEELRTEQRQMAESINQLVTTFRSLAAHLGIAGEPYGGKKADDRDLRGFA
jgi:prefoldin subunit 5